MNINTNIRFPNSQPRSIFFYHKDLRLSFKLYKGNKIKKKDYCNLAHGGYNGISKQVKIKFKKKISTGVSEG